jgi:hypothetical protein
MIGVCFNAPDAICLEPPKLKSNLNQTHSVIKNFCKRVYIKNHNVSAKRRWTVNYVIMKRERRKLRAALEKGNKLLQHNFRLLSNATGIG